MKIGDKFPVMLAGQVVTQAEVSEVDQGTVTLIIPGTRVVMETRTELAAPTPSEPEGETIITGVEGPNNSSEGAEPTPEGAVAVETVPTTPPEPVPGEQAPAAPEQPQAEENA